jgi:ankyrin repeat protein
VDANNIWLDSFIEPSTHQESLGHFYESFAHILIPCKPFAEGQNQILAHKEIRERLPNILANIPERYPGERESTIETLLGPPQLSAALRLLEVVIYLYSNDYLGFWRFNPVLRWIVGIVPFQNLSIILRTKLPTLQPFQNALLVHGIQTGNTLFVKNLLGLGTGLQDWIRLSQFPLEEAVTMGNLEMAKIILDICPEIISKYHQIRWNSVERGLSAPIAQLLVKAGINILRTNEGPPLLMGTISRGDIDLARYLISIGADVNLGYKPSDVEIHLWTPLRIAVDTNRVDLVRLLLENDADVHAVSECGEYYRVSLTPKSSKSFTATALQAAAFNGNIDIVMALLKAGSNINDPAHGNVGQTALYAATNARNFSMAKLLVQSGAHIDAPGCNLNMFPRPALLIAIENNDYTLVELLINSGANPNAPAFGYHGTTLLEAARYSNGNERIVSLLLAKGAEDRIGFNDPARDHFMGFQLLQAIGRGDSERIHLLVERGAEVDVKPMVYTDVEQIGVTSGWRSWCRKPMIHVTMLHLAITVKRVDLSLFKYLLKHVKKSELNYNGHLQPLLHQAVGWRRVEFIEALLDTGVHINTISPLRDIQCDIFRRETGPTALCIASALGYVDIVSLLLDRGADINLRLPSASTPLQTSLMPNRKITKGHADVFELLLSRGADVNAPPASPEGSTALQSAIQVLAVSQRVMHYD